MVHRIRYYGVTASVHRFIPVIVLMLFFGSLLNGCKSPLQPSRMDMTGINLSSGETSRLDIEVVIKEKNFTMEYKSEVLVLDSRAQWNGKANVYCLNAWFEQSCITFCDENSSCKQWRGVMVPSDSSSPAKQIVQWQEMIEEGSGYYHKKPVEAVDYSASLNTISEMVYAFELKNVPLDVTALCDVHLDSLFGSNERLAAYTQANVKMLYGTEDLRLKAVIILSSNSDKILSAVIVVNDTDQELDFHMEDFVLQEGLLPEEWNMVIPNK